MKSKFFFPLLEWIDRRSSLNVPHRVLNRWIQLNQSRFDLLQCDGRDAVDQFVLVEISIRTNPSTNRAEASGLTLRCCFVDHFRNYQRLAIGTLLSVRNGPGRERTRPSYNEHPNGRENRSTIGFHPTKNRFHRTKHDREWVVKFLSRTLVSSSLSQLAGSWTICTYLELPHDCSDRNRNLADERCRCRRPFLNDREGEGADQSEWNASPGWTLLIFLIFGFALGSRMKKRVLWRFFTMMKVILGNGLFR